ESEPTACESPKFSNDFDEAILRPRAAEVGHAAVETGEEPAPIAAATVAVDSPPPPQPPPPPSSPAPVTSGHGRGDFEDVGYSHNDRTSGRKVATFIYRDLKGAPYHRVDKYMLASGRKAFPQYHLEAGQWVKGKPQGPAIPYRLPELLAAPAGATVEIV